MQIVRLSKLIRKRKIEKPKKLFGWHPLIKLGQNYYRLTCIELKESTTLENKNVL